MAATMEQPTWPELSAQIKPSLKLVQSPEFGKPRPQLYKELADLGLPGIESFNFMLKDGLAKAVQDITPVEFALPSGARIKIKFQSAQVVAPQAPSGSLDRNPNVYPKECRMSGTTYRGRLLVQVVWFLDGKGQIPLEKDLGDIPIMLKSNACHLANLTPEQMVAKGEHAEEFGGYFIVKGHERLLRLLTATRKNFPIAVQREKWKTRGKLFTDKGIMIRCVKPDMTSTNNVLHYLQNGTVKFMCSYQKALYFLPVVLVLKALVNVTDEYIFQELILGMEDNLYFRERIAFMLRLLQGEGINSHEQARAFIGKSFRIKFRELPPWYTDDEVCDYLFKKSVMIHLEDNEDKFRAICFAIRKLFTFVQEHCVPEGMDPVMMQEVTLPGHTYLQLIKEKLEKFLGILRFLILKKAGRRTEYELTQGELLWCMSKSGKFEASLETFLATGNLPSSADLGLMQSAGLTIVAENINRMRYMSHFKAIHRGAAFADSRSSEVRQLKPDAWGFLCPVHTPDGAPCGLLNHLTALCRVTNKPEDLSEIPAILAGLGMVSLGTEPPVPYKQCYPVQLEGKVLGYIPDKIAPRLADKLRLMKVRGAKGVPDNLEIVLVPKLKGKVYGQYPGLYLFGGVARMVRPVINLAARAVELIGTFEQVYLDIAVTADEAIEGVTTHQEICETSFLSNLACLIPFPDFNQSPRNMYQCQMGKQTMGTPCHNWPLQTESKLYRLQTPTTPLVRPGHWDKLGMDNFAMGTNAVVAVISYTGYDMEDAMVINRSSLQRGFAYGQVFKSEFVDLRDLSTGGLPRTAIFQRDPSNVELAKFVDTDGLPFPGTRLKGGDPFYCYYIKEEGKFVVEKYKGSEEVFIDNIKLCGLETNPEEIRRVSISYRVPRFPSVGDKFASRAGQKGICSQQWPAEDLPFTESGLIPDIVFNPHGFPSRMTIAMMIESMAGKGGAIHGMVHDATPFKFSEDDTAIDYYGRMLEAAGYNYYGTEKLYSGTDGREMNADIFFGIVHYQRLRHMVSDKYQVRSVGPVDIVTLQPIKGRKRGGGVRFGEMERDALLSHGTSFLLHDRLFHCSDKSLAFLCRTCGSILSPILELPKKLSAYSRELPRIPVCKICKDTGDVQEIEVPHVFKFLIAQLASVNIKVSIKIAAA